MIPVAALVLGVLGWLVSLALTGWYLRTIHQMHREMQTIRRYLQAIYEQQGRR